MRKIYIWADGTWCDSEEIWQMGHMSDDFKIIEVDWNLEYEQVDRIARDSVGMN